MNQPIASEYMFTVSDETVALTGAGGEGRREGGRGKEGRRDLFTAV